MKKVVGILGFGLVGRSYADFYVQHKELLSSFLFNDKQGQISLIVWDQKILSDDDTRFLQSHDIVVLDASLVTMREFVNNCDRVLVSPGIDVQKIVSQHKLVSELDLFATFFKGKTVAITGALGKTTVTVLAAQVLSELNKETIPAIGNIGTPLLYSLDDQLHAAVIELSSFQLERSNLFAPDVAVLTNLYPNHLDRHKTMQVYFEAKWRLFITQKSDQTAILPWELLIGEMAASASYALSMLQSQVIFVTTQQSESLLFDHIKHDGYAVLCLKEDKIVMLTVVYGTVQNEQEIVPIGFLPEGIFTENWLMVIAIAYAFGIDIKELQTFSFPKPLLPNHRLEHFATIGDVTFYNDSKSTVIQATQAAVKKLAQAAKPLIVILGGLGKGVDRSGLIDVLNQIPQLKKIYCFGAERESFGLSQTHETLEQLLDDLFLTLEPGDQVLFSPSGTSYDLFKNYEHRGDVFKELVLKRAAQLHS